MADEDLENMTPEQIAQLQKDNCIFCKIISGEIPSKKVYEDSDFVGILDINPASEGHVILLPKQHFQIMPQMPPELVGTMGIAVSKISETIIRIFKCTGTSIFIANGAVAGQRAPHFILHIIPRSDNDNISLNPQTIELDNSTFELIKDKIHMHVSPRKASNLDTNTKEEIEKINEDIEELDQNNAQEEKNKDIKTNKENTQNPNSNTNSQNLHSSTSKKNTKNETKKIANKQETKKETKSNAKTNTSSKIDYDKLARMFG